MAEHPPAPALPSEQIEHRGAGSIVVRAPWAWLVVAAAPALLALGLLNLRSIGSISSPGSPGPSAWTSQLVWALLGLGLGVVLALPGSRRLERWALVPFGLALLAAIAAALGYGVSVNGASRWVSLLGLRVQVGTLLQVGLIAALAWCSSLVRRLKGALPWVVGLLVPLVLVLPSAALILGQPDTVTAAIVLVVAVVMLAVELRTLPSALVLVVLGAAGSAFAWFFMFHEFQRQRFESFLSPGADRGGFDYFTTAAHDHFTAGGMIGRGWMSFAGASVRGGPELLPLCDAHTDGALAVWAYEWGHVGVGVLLGLYALLLLGLGAIALASSRRGERFGALFALGTAAWIFVQTALHAGVVAGLLPHVSASLPLVSSGGTNVAMTLACLGLAVGAGLARREGPG